MKKNILNNPPKRLVLFTFLCACGLFASANNIQITQASLSEQNSALKTVNIKFTVSWENSFRVSQGPANWDAAWIFAKYRVAVASGGDGIWRHVKMENIVPAISGSTIKVQPEGAFVYRSAPGAGNFSVSDLKFTWIYGAHIESGAGNYIDDDDAIEVQIFGIEMIYVTGNGTFPAGGGNGTNAFQETWLSNSNASVIGSGYPTGLANNNANFPNGVNAFYCMKYELSQQQYVDFLNTLSYTQQLARTSVSPASVPGAGAFTNPNTFRNYIDIKTSGKVSTIPAEYACNADGDNLFGEANDGQWVACNFLSWADLTAYLDWSGLRPMTELEYEKACKGFSGNQEQFAWGSSSLLAVNSIKNPGTADETYNNFGANVAYGNQPGVQGPVRVGAFAAGSVSRAQSGSTYYGIMEMSGNLWERAVTAGNNPTFSGLHGNGELHLSGNSDVQLWPPVNAAGAGFRGGSWLYIANGLRVTDRFSATYVSAGRDKDVGGRGVRTAP